MFLLSCGSPHNPQLIIDKAINVSGGGLLDSSNINFNFRDKHYIAKRNKGDFFYGRSFVNASDSILDVLTNRGFERFVNDDFKPIPDSMAVKYSSSVNSVHYFSVLPYGLNDAAVNKEYLSKVVIKNNPYHKIKITFNEEGGGEDFEDVFVYWVHTETFMVDYLAYSYAEDDGVGLRFREAYNERYIKGIRFVDYINYKPIDGNASLLSLDSLYESKELKELSRINLEQVKVE
ncbi:deoxyribose-phosphate aldolase [Flavivirga eckloniae]|uniref:Deoxyribose-phosphate aldolase n=2 Tax=Flavivirga eckloniae TaxID=1803846 RepID=A0A2K9PWS8_9FLAO|nr:deoxyribose-phosphate aldolase [Flavivirga eckloniae]